MPLQDLRRILIAEIQRPTVDQPFETSAKDIVIGLLSLGFRPVRVEAEGNLMYYVFDSTEVSSVVMSILTNSDLMIPYKGYISAIAIWNMNLTRSKEVRYA